MPSTRLNCSPRKKRGIEQGRGFILSLLHSGLPVKLGIVQSHWESRGAGSLLIPFIQVSLLGHRAGGAPWRGPNRKSTHTVLHPKGRRARSQSRFQLNHHPSIWMCMSLLVCVPLSSLPLTALCPRAPSHPRPLIS